MDTLNLNQIKMQVKEATNQAARTHKDYFVIGFTSFGLIYYDVTGKAKII